MKEYRSRFIRLSMGLIAAVLALALTGIAVYMYFDYNAELQATMKQVLAPFDAVPAATDTGENAAGPEDSARSIVTVFYTPSTNRMTVLSNRAGLEDAMLSQLIAAASEQEESYGKLTAYDMIYYREQTMDTLKLAFVSAGYIRRAMTELAEILLAIFAGAMALFYGISRYIAGLAVRPLEEAMARERQFVADVSHDLKTPLTVILANGSILRDAPEKTVTEQMSWVDSTEAAARSMLSMVNEMLTLSQVDAERQTPRAEPVPLSPLAEKACLQLESVAFEKGVTLQDEIQPDVTVSGRPEYLSRITASLIENGVKYEPAGGTVRVSLKTERGKAVFSVCNPGAIIPPEDLPHIFERFYRGDKTRSSGTGFGLGLAIVKGMAESMGGAVSVESGGDKGTVFTLILPLAPGEVRS